MTNSVSGQHNVPLTDELLLQRLRSPLEGERAFNQIFDRYNKQLYRISYSILQDEELSKDLVQDVFIDLWNRRDTSAIRNLSAYLLRAIKFQVLKQLRDGKIHDRHLKMMQRIQFVNQTEETINFNEMERLLREGVDQLPPKCREVFVLSRMENLSIKEISLRLNISSKTVEGQITKALSRLRTRLDNTVLLIMAFLQIF